MVWVDTAFNGGLVSPRDEIERLELQEYSSTPAILAVGNKWNFRHSRAIWSGLETSIAHRSLPKKVRIRCSDDAARRT